MARWKENYRLHGSNGTIAVDGYESFGQDQSSREAINKYGSFNVATITVRKSSGAVVQLNGVNGETYTLTQPGTFTIQADEGQFFDWINIVDGDSTGITAGEVTISLSIAEGVN